MGHNNTVQASGVSTAATESVPYYCLCGVSFEHPVGVAKLNNFELPNCRMPCFAGSQTDMAHQKSKVVILRTVVICQISSCSVRGDISTWAIDS